MIVLDKIVLRRGSNCLLDEASATVYPGRRVGVIGANGSGKTSLFKLILGELHLDGGELKVPKQWRIAHMAQEVHASARSALDFVLDGDQALRRVQADIAAAESSDDHDRLVQAYAELEAIHGYEAKNRAEVLLHGLGFSQAQIMESVTDFSGGWRIRLNLAQALMCPSDCLLLDEPTNHLDIDATVWLEGWLKNYRGTILLISHDRDFLDNVVDDVISLEANKIYTYAGNYSAYERQRGERLAQQQAVYEKQQQRIAEINKFVTRFKAKASKAKQAQSRVKELARMEKIAPAHVDSPFYFTFLEAEKNSSPLIALDDVRLGYGDKVILKNVRLNVQLGSRIGLLGPNGAGKSTLIKSLVGDLPLLQGERVCGQHLNIGYFAQHQLEALDLNASAALHLQRLSPKASEQSIRNFLGGFNFHGDKAIEPIKPFSGGEKARLALAIIVWQKPNLLLLDEPTNHLDLEMRYALTVALQAYKGALIVISHDRHLLRNTVDEYYRVADGNVASFEGTLDDYQLWLSTSVKDKNTVDKQPSAVANNTQQSDKRAKRQQAAALREQAKPLTVKIKALEKAMQSAQQILKETESELTVADIYENQNKDRLQALLKQQAEQKVILERSEEQWLQAQEALEALQSL